MSPSRMMRRRFLPLYVMSLLVLTSMFVAAWSLHQRSDEIDRVLYQQCVSNEQQDAVIVAVLLSIPADQRNQVVQDAISSLEPPDEPDCSPPTGTEP